MLFLPSNYISEEDAKKILEPHLIILSNCIKAAWLKWENLNEIAPDFRFPLSSRTRACCIYDHICHEIKHQFLETKGVYVSESRGFLLLNIDGLVLIRFKKINSLNKSSNIATYQQYVYNAQLELPGIPNSAARLTAGYLLDKFQASIKDMRMTFPMRKGVLWSFSLPGTEIQAIQPPMPFEEPVKAKVKAKGVSHDTKKMSEQ